MYFFKSFCVFYLISPFFGTDLCGYLIFGKLLRESGEVLLIKFTFDLIEIMDFIN